ncbi:hypothetical protein [Aquitalea sp. LB_tupeE]|uniref:hypothetical protein n=1 Tax=Aquitalea sp. LB_tupeE TaxID=2748078 RepID=UPI0015BC690D|nr:hypothetical protein [Aquitalea sp. LB_tupeE]NWK79711.1 hypothetical protein [Aquitalea sp. LB_tupeE]
MQKTCEQWIHVRPDRRQAFKRMGAGLAQTLSSLHSSRNWGRRKIINLQFDMHLSAIDCTNPSQERSGIQIDMPVLI